MSILRLTGFSLLTVALCGCGGSSDGGGATVPTCTLSAVAGGSLEQQGLGWQESRPQHPDWSAPHVAGQVLIVGGEVLSAQALGALSGVQWLQVDPGVRLALTPTHETDRAFAQRLANAGLGVQPNFIYQSLTLPNDPGYPGHSGVSVGRGVYDQDYLPRVGFPEAWASLEAAGVAPTGVVTAVLDTGVDTTHPDLSGRLLPGCTFDDQGKISSGAPEVSDNGVQDRGHGTGVAGLIGAATNNGVGLAGATWSGQTVLPLKVLGEFGATTAGIRSALNYALGQGAKVINMSLGYKGNSGDQALDNALAQASRSAVLVAAAGNTSGDGIYFPASHPNVIAVGAAARQDQLACYSARPGGASGTRQLDIVAPGGNGGTTASVTNDLGGNLALCRQVSGYDMLVLSTQDRGGYTLRMGTSQAAPLVSGVASLMWAANPNLTAVQVKQKLLDSTRKVGSLKMLDAGAAVRSVLP